MLCKKDIDTLSPIYPDVDWSKTIWSFIHYSKTDPDSDLSDDVDDLIMISLEHSDGGCLFELIVTYSLLNSRNQCIRPLP